MQKYREKRILAILKESIRIYQQSKSLLLLSFGIFMGGLILYTLLLWPAPVSNSDVEQRTLDKEALMKLEDSISATNQHLQQYADAISKQFKNEEAYVNVAPDPVSNSNKQLIIKKIEAILRYLKTPLYQFNQLPTYFINNPELEKEIKHYNEEQVSVASVYNREKKNDSSLLKSLQLAQNQLIIQLNAEKGMLIQQIKQPKRQARSTLDTSKVLTSLFNKRDSITLAYSNQLARYQKQLDGITFMQLNRLSLPSATQHDEEIADIEIRAAYPIWHNIFWVGALLVIAVIIPVLITVINLYKFPFVKRLEDLQFFPSNTNIKLELNKDVNQELVAFNYEQLVKELDHLTKNKHSIMAFYSAEAADEQYAIGAQLAILLAKLAHPVLHIQLLKEGDQKSADHQNTYTLPELFRRLESIQNQLVVKSEHCLHQQLTILVDENSLEKKGQMPSELRYYWALQHFFVKTKVKEMLANFEKHFTYVLINTPDFSQLDFSLLFFPLKSIRILVFKSETTSRKLANRLSKLTTNESFPTIHILDFSENKSYPSLNKKNNHEKESHELHTVYS